MKRFLITVFFVGIFSSLCSQEIELDSCLVNVNKNYPSLRQKDLEKEINTIANKINNMAWLPEISLNGQGSYQSDVTSISLPIMQTPRISNDQYKAFVDLNQTLYDGGAIKLKKDLQNLSSQINDTKVDIELRSISLQTQKFFFNALLARENIVILKNSQEEINERIKNLEAGVKYGTVKQSQVDILKVELLKIDQRLTDLESNYKACLDIISLFTGMRFTENSVIKRPEEYKSTDNDFRNRAEFKNLDFQKESLDKNFKLTRSKQIPKASLFGQAGYGKPGLNMLNPDFDTYYIVGARLRWDLTGFYSFKNNKKLTQLYKDNIEVQKEVLTTNLSSQKVSLDATLAKVNILLDKDKEIVRLRQGITQVSAAELDNGITTSTNYLIEKNAETQSIQTLKLHEIEKLATLYEIKNITGN